MLENRLGLLFGQIADSIRGGLGDIGTMKPNSFPAKIDDIVALLGTAGESGGGSSGDRGALTFASGSFSPSQDSERVSIAHGLGVMPDLIIVQLYSSLFGNSLEEAAETMPMVSAWGMRSYLGTGNHSGFLYPTWGLGSADGIDNMRESNCTSGFIYCPDENTFQVGSISGAGSLYQENEYRWLAISGMGGLLSEPVVEPLEITENGTYEAPAGIAGYSPVTVDIDPTVQALLPYGEIGGFALDSYFHAYTPGFVSPAPFILESGKAYRVKWDGEVFDDCVAYTIPAEEAITAIGNGSSLGLQGNDEPFLILHNATNDNIQIFSTEEEASHFVGIWQKLAQEIRLQEKTITENGEYTADSGFDGLGKVLVNIAASGASPVMAAGQKYNTDQTEFIVTHGLGVIPDIIIVWVSWVGNSIGQGTAVYFSVREAIKNKLGSSVYMHNNIELSGQTISVRTSNMVDITSGPGLYNSLFVKSADKNTFTVPANHLKNCHYSWLAIGGLTE